VELASRVIESIKDDDLSIGIITPYRKQARLILKIAEDRKLLSANNLRINTIHSFQGAEENIIIIDCVEGIGAKKWSILNEFNNTDNAKLILNVAMTRAESKLYIIANQNYFNQLFPPKALLREVFNHFKEKGRIIPSTELFNNFKDENFDYWVEKINSLNDRPFTKGESFSENEFWVSFLNDLSIIENELIIFSPFLTSERAGKLCTFFHELLAKEINIYIITLPPNDQPAIMRDDAKEVIKFLKSIGIIVKFRNKMHEKIALLDRKIKWIGSLNILSHKNRTEYMERFVGERLANELYDKFDLENLLTKENRNGENCPKCNDGYILIKKQRRYPYKKFYGCSSFPQCDWLENIE
jgi:hypothetical protein